MMRTLSGKVTLEIVCNSGTFNVAVLKISVLFKFAKVPHYLKMSKVWPVKEQFKRCVICWAQDIPRIILP